MKKTLPSRTVEVCDLCHRDGERHGLVLRKCVRCGREHCLLCEGIIPGCVVPVKVCCACGTDEAVVAVCDRYAAKLSRIAKDRDAALVALGKP